MNQTLEAVVTDLDGTLFGADHQVISPRDRQTIARLKAKGIFVFIATGRHFEFCTQHVRDIGFDYPAACANGAQVYDYQAQKTLYASLLPSVTVKAMAEYLFSHQIHFICYTTEGAFFSEGNPRAQFWKQVLANFDEPFRTPIRYIDSTFPLWEYDAFKFLLPYSSKEVEGEIVKIFNRQGELEIAWSGKELMDINARGGSKGNAVRFLAERYGFALEHTLAIGDNFNDGSMLDVCGYPVAPLGAEEAIKAKACFVTLPCDQSPLTHAVSTLFPALL